MSKLTSQIVAIALEYISIVCLITVLVMACIGAEKVGITPWLALILYIFYVLFDIVSKALKNLIEITFNKEN